ncbi:acyl-CoA dehydrogenase [Saccharopolyspora rhizosphaerae]|uniref:Acyl-CoA dehydrogenase n=1 Tax=Saccharopolyspora rhizosphaerae TaxID=2492662 RepID=A0A426JWK1_9PSEU|nr:acyl-CoA dehydrogenase family protein [Saccharopolyspora rhizosphaerae]RRO17558.1 acyl-CoA dehydrogenase [Saccharopolyspora rhizosphaerae]
MEFTLGETQQAVRDLAAEVLTRETERASASTGIGFDDSVWKALGEAGLLSLPVPERLGGAGLGPLEVGLVLTEIGKAGVAVPALATLAFGVLPLARHADEAQQDRLLAEPDRVFSAALNEPSKPLPAQPGAVLRNSRVTGRKTGVLHADTAHRLLVSASTGDGPAIVLVDPHADGVTLHSVTSSAGTEWVVGLDDVDCELLGAPGEALLADVHACALAGMCALGDGVVAGALELTAEHLRTRHQFGKPLAAFQAVAQQIADVYVVNRTLHLAALSACWRLGTGRDAGEDLDVAAFWLADQAPAAMHTCHHLHGGLGVDITYPMHRYYSQVKDLARLAGGAAHRVDVLARHA